MDKQVRIEGIITRAIEDKSLVGVSAGSMVTNKDLQLKTSQNDLWGRFRQDRNHARIELCQFLFSAASLILNTSRGYEKKTLRRQLKE